MVDVVVSATAKMRVEIPGTDRVYELRAPTFGEVGEMAARAEGMMAPSDAVYAEVVREAVLASDAPQADKERHAAAYDDFFAAQDTLRSLVASLPEDTKEWSAEQRREFADANAAFRRASRARDQAEWLVRDVPAVRAMKQKQGAAVRDDQAEAVAMCLGIKPAEARALPVGDFLLLHARALSMVRPSEVAEKN